MQQAKFFNFCLRQDIFKRFSLVGDFLIKFACGGRFVKKILPEAGDFLKKIHLQRAIFKDFRL